MLVRVTKIKDWKGEHQQAKAVLVCLSKILHLNRLTLFLPIMTLDLGRIPWSLTPMEMFLQQRVIAKAVVEKPRVMETISQWKQGQDIQNVALND